MKNKFKRGDRVKLLGRASIFGKEAIIISNRANDFLVRIDKTDFKVVVRRMNIKNNKDKIKIGGTD